MRTATSLKTFYMDKTVHVWNRDPNDLYQYLRVMTNVIKTPLHGPQNKVDSRVSSNFTRE